MHNVLFALVAVQAVFGALPRIARNLPEPVPACADAKPVNDIGQTLDLVTARMDENLSKLRTWRGTFRIRTLTDWTGPGMDAIKQIGEKQKSLEKRTSIVTQRRYKGEFVVDVVGNRLFTTHELTAPTVVVSNGEGPDVEIPDSLSYRSVVTDDLYIFMDPERNHTATFLGLEDWRIQEGRVAFRDPVERARGEEFGNLTNPARFFWVDGHDVPYPYSQYLQQYVKGMGPRDSKKFGDFIAIKELASQGDSTYCLTTAGCQQFVIDSKVGYNVRLFRQVDPGNGQPMAIREIDYIEQAGIFLPQFVRFVMYFPDGRPQIDYEWTLEDSVVNEPVDDAIFSYQGLGLKDGERVIDRVENIAYIMANGQLTEPKPFDINVPSLPRIDRPPENNDDGALSDEWRRNIILLNVAAIVVLGLWIVVRALWAVAKKRS